MQICHNIFFLFVFIHIFTIRRVLCTLASAWLGVFSMLTVHIFMIGLRLPLSNMAGSNMCVVCFYFHNLDSCR